MTSFTGHSRQLQVLLSRFKLVTKKTPKTLNVNDLSVLKVLGIELCHWPLIARLSGMKDKEETEEGQKALWAAAARPAPLME